MQSGDVNNGQPHSQELLVHWRERRKSLPLLTPPTCEMMMASGGVKSMSRYTEVVDPIDNWTWRIISRRLEDQREMELRLGVGPDGELKIEVVDGEQNATFYASKEAPGALIAALNNWYSIQAHWRFRPREEKEEAR